MSEANDESSREAATSTDVLEVQRRVAVVGTGRTLAMAAALAMVASALPTVQVRKRREVDWWGDRQEPINTGRRAEKDAAALAKAEAKRQRKAAKRAKNMPSNA